MKLTLDLDSPEDVGTVLATFSTHASRLRAAADALDRMHAQVVQVGAEIARSTLSAGEDRPEPTTPPLQLVRTPADPTNLQTPGRAPSGGIPMPDDAVPQLLPRLTAPTGATVVLPPPPAGDATDDIDDELGVHELVNDTGLAASPTDPHIVMHPGGQPLATLEGTTP